MEGFLKRIILLVLLTVFSVGIINLTKDSVQNVITKASNYYDDEIEIKIFHTNDIHSRVENFPKIKAYIDEEDDASILLDAGDTFHGQSFGTLEKGSSIARVLKLMNYTAMVPGNHDFNYGSERLEELGKEADITILASNIRRKGELEYISTLIKEVHGIKIGIFGIATPETPYKTNPNNTLGLDFGNKESVIEDVNNAVKTLKDSGANVIIALTHLGIDPSSELKSTDIAKKVEGIDLIIDGHSHTKLEKYKDFNKNNKTQITSTGEYLNAFGEVSISFNKDKTINEIELEIIDLDNLNKKDESLETLIKEIKERQKPILEEVVAHTPIRLEGDRKYVRCRETNLGKLITSAMLKETGAEIAILNGGGIRDSIEEGSIKKEDILKVLPFGNYIVTKKIKGIDLLAAINHGIVKGSGSYMHSSGLDIEYKSEKTQEGKEIYKISKVLINGEKLDIDREYLIAMNDFMALGGDGYFMFKKYDITNEFSSLDEALIEYIIKIGEKGLINM